MDAIYPCSAEWVPYRSRHGKRVRVPTEDHHRSANPINCGPLLRNGMRIGKAQMHGNMSICITLEYREKSFVKQHLL